MRLDVLHRRDVPFLTIACYVAIAAFFLLYGVVSGYTPIVGVIFVLLAALSILIFYNIRAGVLLAFVSIPMDRMAKLTPDGTLTVAKVVILITLATWFVKSLIYKDDKLVSVPVQSFLGILGVLFLVFSLTSVINAQSTAAVIGQLFRRTNLFFLYLMLVAIIRDRDLLIKVLWFFLVALVLVSFMGIYELVTEIPILSYAGLEANIADTAAEGYRIIGPTGDPDFHTLAMNMGVGITFIFFYAYRYIWLRAILAFFFLLFIANILGSGSRGGLVAFLSITMTFWFFIKFRYKWLIASCGVALMVFIFLGMVMYQSGGVGRYTGETGGKTIVWRLGWSEMGMAMFKSHPILGIGTANFMVQYHKYTVPTVPKAPILMHNSFVQVLVENGILGLFTYIGLYLVSLWNCWRVMRHSNDRWLHAMSVTFFAITIGFGLFALTSNVLENEDYWILFAFSVITLYLFRKEEFTKSAGSYGGMLDGT